MLQPADRPGAQPGGLYHAPGWHLDHQLAPFYNNFRWQRFPAESVSFARNFKFDKEGRYNLQVRMEFQNIFNRTFLPVRVCGQPQSGDRDNPLRRNQHQQ